MTKISTLLIFRDGSVAAFNAETGQQEGRLQQQSLQQVLTEHSEKLGYDLSGCEIRMAIGTFFVEPKA